LSEELAEEGTDLIPTMYGYDYIEILNNVNSSNEIIKGLRDRFQNTAGYKQTTVNRDVHCTDYQYSDADKTSENMTNGILMIQYVIGNAICTETDYQDTPSEVSGSDTIVIGIE